MALEKRLKTSENLLSEICCNNEHINAEVLEYVLTLAIEIAREGREGKKIGTIFIISDSDEVLEQSWCLILDPLLGHPANKRYIGDYNMRETIKELAQLDGAFLVSCDGMVISACRYINASAKGVNLPLGLGSRHMAAASITKHTDALAVVVSESAVVRIFDGGEIVGETIPELSFELRAIIGLCTDQ